MDRINEYSDSDLLVRTDNVYTDKMSSRDIATRKSYG